MNGNNYTNKNFYLLDIFENLFSEFFNVSKNFYKRLKEIQKTAPDKLEKIFDKIERELEYEENSYGITEIISCPVKAKLRRQGIEVEVKNIEIADGFGFENMFKLAVMEYFGIDKVEPEKLLEYEVILDNGEKFKINGHLDIFIDLREEKNKIIGLELKDTILHFDNSEFGAPPPFKFIAPNESHKFNISSKYILQAKIQRKILEHMYPNVDIETYLIIKTNLRTKSKLRKSILIYPVTESISDEQLKEIVKYFVENEKPRLVYECKLCPYKQEGYCKGYNIEELENDKSIQLDDLNQSKEQYIYELLERRENLLKELKQVEEQIKKSINGSINYKGKEVGWVESVKREYNIRLINKILRDKGVPSQKRAEFFIFNWRKFDELKKLLDEEELKKVVNEKKIKKFKL